MATILDMLPSHLRTEIEAIIDYHKTNLLETVDVVDEEKSESPSASVSLHSSELLLFWILPQTKGRRGKSQKK